jgi:beta-glucan synthesis-associated protein KRE6
VPEPDDALHAPDAKEVNNKGHIFTARGLQNLGCLFILVAAIMTLLYARSSPFASLFISLFFDKMFVSAGYPIISFLLKKPPSTLGGFNLGRTNASGQIAQMAGNWGLIDVETPQDAYTHKSYHDPTQEFQLVFSDEFNTDGRSFYPGDDPYWEAVDMNYYSVCFYTCIVPSHTC